jgi:hypothetical protein
MTIDLGVLSPGLPALTGALPGTGGRPGAPRCVRFLTLFFTMFADMWLLLLIGLLEFLATID